MTNAGLVHKIEDAEHLLGGKKKEGNSNAFGNLHF